MTLFKQHGFVLPLALIMLAILTGLAVTLSEQAHTKMLEIQRQQTSWRNELEYRSALQQIIRILLTGEVVYNKVYLDPLALPIDGQRFKLKGLEVQIQDGAGLIGLGHYEPEWVLRLLSQFCGTEQALRITDELADWVDQDNARHRYGLESIDYLRQRHAYLPRNIALRSLDELLELPSMTPELYNGDAERYGLKELLLTGGVDHLNIATAPAPVIQAVLGLSAQQTRKIISLRNSNNWTELNKLLPTYHRAFGEFGAYNASNLFRIRLRKQNDPALTVLLRLTFNKSTPYEILLWHYPDTYRGWI